MIATVGEEPERWHPIRCIAQLREIVSRAQVDGLYKTPF